MSVNPCSVNNCRICLSDRSQYVVPLAVSRCDFYVKIAEISRISYVKIADQNWGNLTLEMTRRDTERTRRGHGEDAQRLAALRWPRFPFGVLFLMVFFSFRFDPLFFSPVTMISTDCSSCSFVSASLPNVVQRQQPLCPWPFKPVST